MNRKAAVFLRQAALAAFVIGMGLMTLCAVIWSADNQAVSNRFSQHVELVRDGFFSGLLLSAVVLAAYLAAHALIERFGGLKLNAALGALWLAAAMVWIFAVRVSPWTDARRVMEAAVSFAQDDFSALHYEVTDYFNIYTYQLGIVFPLEMLERLFPKADLARGFWRRWRRSSAAKSARRRRPRRCICSACRRGCTARLSTT